MHRLRSLTAVFVYLDAGAAHALSTSGRPLIDACRTLRCDNTTGGYDVWCETASRGKPRGHTVGCPKCASGLTTADSDGGRDDDCMTVDWSAISGSGGGCRNCQRACARARRERRCRRPWQQRRRQHSCRRPPPPSPQAAVHLLYKDPAGKKLNLHRPREARRGPAAPPRNTPLGQRRPKQLRDGAHALQLQCPSESSRAPTPRTTCSVPCCMRQRGGQSRRCTARRYAACTANGTKSAQNTKKIIDTR